MHENITWPTLYDVYTNNKILQYIIYIYTVASACEFNSILRDSVVNPSVPIGRRRGWMVKKHLLTPKTKRRHQRYASPRDMMHTVSTRAASVGDYDYTDHSDLIYSLALQLLLLRGSVPVARVTSFLCTCGSDSSYAYGFRGGDGETGGEKIL